MKALLTAVMLALPLLARAEAPELKRAEKAARAVSAAEKPKAGPAAAEERAAQRASAQRAAKVENELEAAAAEPGFKKFLTIKEVGFQKASDGVGLEVVEASRPVTAPNAVVALLDGYKLWDRSEAPRVANGCLEAGDPCSSSIWCCRSMMCRGGTCAGSNNDCVPRGRRCSSSIWCCGAGIFNDQGYCQ